MAVWALLAFLRLLRFLHQRRAAVATDMLRLSGLAGEQGGPR